MHVKRPNPFTFLSASLLGALCDNEGDGGGGTTPPTPTPPAPAPAATDKGFPEGTPVEQMTPAQQAAYHQAQSRRWEARAKKFDGLTDDEFAAMKTKAARADALDNELSSDKDKAVKARADGDADEAARVLNQEYMPAS